MRLIMSFIKSDVLRMSNSMGINVQGVVLVVTGDASKIVGSILTM